MKIAVVEDPSPRTGVFIGDLKYGRCRGTVPQKDVDFSAGQSNENQPAMPLTLVAPRDPEVWRKDERIKDAKKQAGDSYLATVFQSFMNGKSNLRANFHLTVGKQRM